MTSKAVLAIFLNGLTVASAQLFEFDGEAHAICGFSKSGHQYNMFGNWNSPVYYNDPATYPFGSDWYGSYVTSYDYDNAKFAVQYADSSGVVDNTELIHGLNEVSPIGICPKGSGDSVIAYWPASDQRHFKYEAFKGQVDSETPDGNWLINFDDGSQKEIPRSQVSKYLNLETPGLYDAWVTFYAQANGLKTLTQFNSKGDSYEVCSFPRYGNQFKVFAEWGANKWYETFITTTKSYEDRLFEVQYRDGTIAEQAGDTLSPIGQCPQVGDSILSYWNLDGEKLYPGTIISETAEGNWEISLYDGSQAVVARSWVHKLITLGGSEFDYMVGLEDQIPEPTPEVVVPEVVVPEEVVPEVVIPEEVIPVEVIPEKPVLEEEVLPVEAVQEEIVVEEPKIPPLPIEIELDELPISVPEVIIPELPVPEVVVPEAQEIESTFDELQETLNNQLEEASKQFDEAQAQAEENFDKIKAETEENINKVFEEAFGEAFAEESAEMIGALAVGLIVAYVVGGVCLCVITILCCVWCCRKRNQDSAPKQMAETKEGGQAETERPLELELQQ